MRDKAFFKWSDMFPFLSTVSGTCSPDIWGTIVIIWVRRTWYEKGKKKKQRKINKQIDTNANTVANTNTITNTTQIKPNQNKIG